MTTFVERFAPVVDRLRSLHAQFGTRPYRVWQVKTRWSGGRRGEGEEVVVSEREILPTPRVTGIDSLDAVLNPTGREEEGGILLSEVSLTLKEEEVAFDWGHQVPPGEDWFWEVRYGDGRRRRFATSGAPERDVTGFGWRVRLRRQREDRQASGLAYR